MGAVRRGSATLAQEFDLAPAAHHHAAPVALPAPVTLQP
jgi:hypothetical protein